MLFKTVIPLEKLKNKDVSSLNNIVCIAKLSLVTLFSSIQLTDDAWFHQ